MPSFQVPADHAAARKILAPFDTGIYPDQDQECEPVNDDEGRFVTSSWQRHPTFHFNALAPILSGSERRRRALIEGTAHRRLNAEREGLNAHTVGGRRSDPGRWHCDRSAPDRFCGGLVAFETYLTQKAAHKGVELSDLVNQLLKKEIEIIEAVK